MEILKNSRYYAEPFDHWEVDISETLSGQLESILSEYPDLSKNAERSFNNRFEKKLTSRDLKPAARRLVDNLNGYKFRSELSELTGIPDLLADNDLTGGGYHEIKRGGKLGMHIDFNRLKNDRYRRLNLLIYLNKDWKPEYKGELLLGKPPVKRILPEYGKMVIFTTTENSWHGHPEPLMCPLRMSRRSIALYYYTKEEPEYAVESHDTRFSE